MAAGALKKRKLKEAGRWVFGAERGDTPARMNPLARERADLREKRLRIGHNLPNEDQQPTKWSLLNDGKVKKAWEGLDQMQSN